MAFPVARLRLQNLVFHAALLVLVGLLAWISQQTHRVFDWTDGQRNSLNPASRQVLDEMPGGVEIEVFLGPAESPRNDLRQLLLRLQRYKPDIRFSIVDPQAQPGRARELGVSGEGEMIVRYQQRQERLRQISETSVSNALRRLGRSRDRWLAFVEGHGERRPDGAANHDLAQFGARLAERGIRTGLLNLALTPQLPANLDALVLASPQHDYLPGELAVLRQFVEAGGNLLLLLDPDANSALRPLLGELGLGLQPGTVVDPGTVRFNIDNPAFALVSDYPAEQVTPGFGSISLFPQAVALRVEADLGWSVWPVLRTGNDSWSETGPLAGEIAFDAELGDVGGPLHLGLALSRPGRSREQRILVVGDGDFLANAYLGNGGNLELGLAMIEWLAGDTDAAGVVAPALSEQELRIPETALIVLALAALLGVPGVLLLAAYLVWRRRRAR